MAAIIELTNANGRSSRTSSTRPDAGGVPATYSRRDIVDAILFLARTGYQWRYLPDRFPPWPAVWQQ